MIARFEKETDEKSLQFSRGHSTDAWNVDVTEFQANLAFYPRVNEGYVYTFAKYEALGSIISYMCGYISMRAAVMRKVHTKHVAWIKGGSTEGLDTALHRGPAMMGSEQAEDLHWLKQ